MGKRGPKPTPTAILQLRGSTLVTQERRDKEVQGPSGSPDQPDWLDDGAVQAWNYLVPLLSQMGVLTRIDGHALARYCRLWSRWRQAEDFLTKHGEMYPLKDDDGKPKCFQPWPQVAIANKLAQQLTRLEQEFGMTPSARSRIQLHPVPCGEPSRAKTRFFQKTG